MSSKVLVNGKGWFFVFFSFVEAKNKILKHLAFDLPNREP
jgi:hypothetical protein